MYRSNKPVKEPISMRIDRTATVTVQLDMKEMETAVRMRVLALLGEQSVIPMPEDYQNIRVNFDYEDYDDGFKNHVHQLTGVTITYTPKE